MRAVRQDPIIIKSVKPLLSLLLLKSFSHRFSMDVTLKSGELRLGYQLSIYWYDNLSKYGRCVVIKNVCCTPTRSTQFIINGSAAILKGKLNDGYGLKN